MKFLPLIFANLRRKKIRTILSIGSFAVAFFLFGLLGAIHYGFRQGIDVAGADRLVVIGRTSIIQPLPLPYYERLKSMGLGAILAALNTMYSAVAERSREIAVLRALGFGGVSIVTSFLTEALIIALIGGLLGCLAVLPVNGITTGTMNWQTFAHLSFAFRITPDLLAWGVVFALLMGVAGGLPPAVRASRSSVAATLRAL